MQVDLPVPLGIDVERQVHARQLARQPGPALVDDRAVGPLVEHLFIVGVGLGGVGLEQLQHPLGRRPLQGLAAALAVDRGLRRQVLRRRDIELIVEDRVARRILVHVGGAVPDPLPRHEDRQLDVILDLAHLEGRGVAVPQQVMDQPGIAAGLLGALAVGHPRRLHDGAIVAHVVDHAHEAVVEHRDRLVEDLFEPRRRGPAGLIAGVAKLPDFGLLGLGQEPGIWYLRAHDAPVSVIRWPDSGTAAFGFVLRSGQIRNGNPPAPP
jgi:hypothetical protein